MSLEVRPRSPIPGDLVSQRIPVLPAHEYRMPGPPLIRRLHECPPTPSTLERDIIVCAAAVAPAVTFTERARHDSVDLGCDEVWQIDQRDDDPAGLRRSPIGSLRTPGSFPTPGSLRGLHMLRSPRTRHDIRTLRTARGLGTLCSPHRTEREQPHAQRRRHALGPVQRAHHAKACVRIQRGGQYRFDLRRVSSHHHDHRRASGRQQQPRTAHHPRHPIVTANKCLGHAHAPPGPRGEQQPGNRYLARPVR